MSVQTFNPAQYHLGLIGSAFFNSASSGVIANAVYTGVVSSVTALGAKGHYQINFNSNEVDTLYRVVGTCGDASGDQFGYYLAVPKSLKTVSSFVVRAHQDYRTTLWVDDITILIFRPN